MFRLAAAARQQVNPCAQATTARTRTATACARTATARARTATTRARPRAAIPYEELDFVLNDPLTSQCASADPVKLESDVKTVDVVKERIDDDDSDASDDTDDDNSDVYDVCQEKNSIRRTLKTEAFARDMHCVDSVSDNEAGAGMSLMSPAGKSHVSAALTSANPAASPTVAAPVTPMYIIDPHNFTSGRGSQVSSADQIINIMPVTYDQHVASDTSSTAGVVSQAAETGQTCDNASISHNPTTTSLNDAQLQLPEDVSLRLVVNENQSQRLRDLLAVTASCGRASGERHQQPTHQLPDCYERHQQPTHQLPASGERHQQPSHQLPASGERNPQLFSCFSSTCATQHVIVTAVFGDILGA